jgi:hypothetical protein
VREEGATVETLRLFRKSRQRDASQNVVFGEIISRDNFAMTFQGRDEISEVFGGIISIIWLII